MTSPSTRPLIEVAVPLEAINVASAREKSIRYGHPSTLHLWRARTPLVAVMSKTCPRTGLGVTSVNHDCAELLARAEVPR